MTAIVLNPGHPARGRLPRTGRVRAVLACAAVFAMTAGTTSAAFQDTRSVQLGTGEPGSGLGDPQVPLLFLRGGENREFELSESVPVVLDLAPNSATSIGSDDEVLFAMTLRTAEGHAASQRVTSTIVVDAGAHRTDPAPWLRMSLTLPDGRQLVGTADAINAVADRTFVICDSGCTPGEVRLSIALDDAAPFAVAGASIGVRLQFAGEAFHPGRGGEL
ncbi:hypothetical protein ACL9RL_13125 [Plantibacter sp. Mn2098]|uniref:hypothetical protein n=1 Tax=Plantibacter sp. Mn2098 TaxID=3395266 RepID=UPI003BD6DB79